MKLIWFVCVPIFSIKWTVAQIVDESVQIAGTNDKCAEYCSKAFKNQDAPVKSCQQGCRLYSVLQFVDKTSGKDGLLTEPNSTAISLSCQKECSDAYKDSTLKGACVDGCQHQTPFTTGHLKIVMDDSMPMFSFANKMMAEAFGKFDELQNCMMEKFGMMKDWFKNDPLTKFEGELQHMNFFSRIDSQFRNMFNELSRSSQGMPAPKLEASTVNPLFSYAKSIARNGAKDASSQGSQVAAGDVKAKQPVSSSFDDSGEPLLVIKIVNSNGLFDGDERRMMGPMMMDNKAWSSFTQLNEKPHEPSPPILINEKTYFGSGGNGMDSDDTWLACFARRTQNLSMLTRWLLCVALMMSILCMIYLCLAVMRASQQRRQRLYLQYKMGKTDAVYLMPPPTYEKVTPCPGYAFQENEKRETPPPAYEIAVGPFPVQNSDSTGHKA